MKKSKNLSKLVAMAVLLGGVTCMHSAWAELGNYGNLENNVITITGSKSEEGKTNTYSKTNYVGVDGSSGSLGSDINSIITASGGVAVAVYGIKTGNSYGVTATSITDGINVKSTGGDSFAISLEGTGTTTITGLGSITAETSGSDKTAYGIYSKGSDVNFANNVSFVTSGGNIKATSTTGSHPIAYGTYIREGKMTVSNIKSIEVNSVTATGICGTTDSKSDIGSESEYSFIATGGDITVSGSDGSTGIQVKKNSKMTVTNLKSITVKADAGIGNVHGIYSGDSAENNVSFITSGGTINATTVGGNAYGINAIEQSKMTVENLGSITAESSGSDQSAYGIYDKSSGESNISFVTSGGTIKATSTTGTKSTAYGAQVRAGKVTVSNIKIVEVTSASATGLFASNISNDPGSEGNYSFIVTGGDIKVTSTSSDKTSYGVAARTDSKTTVTNLKSIEITGEGTLYGIYSWGNSAENNVSFVTSGGTINATSKAENAYGISATGNSKMTVKNLGSITVKTTATDKNAYGIYSGDSAENNVSFKGNGGQAITATAATAANAYSIYAKKQGATTVNFESSILSGKVYQGDTATLTLNFNNGGVWTPKDGDVEGTIAVNVNNGGKIVFDLPSNIEKDGTVLQMSGTVTIQDGSTIQVINGKANKLQDDDEICLIDNSANITLGTNVVKQHSNNGITWSEAEIYLNQDDNTKLMYKMKKLGLDPDGSKAPVEGMAAAAASVNTSSDLVTGAGMANMITSTAAAGGGAEPFAAASFGSSRLETGSHVDSKGYGIVVGVGKKVFNKAGNKTTGGIFVEYGNSDTDTYNNAVTGSGKSINKGVGYMMRYDHTSGNYYEGMIHAGKINSSWSNSTGGYSMSPTYFGGALTYGHKFMVAEDRQLSVYGSYIYGRTGGGDAKIAGYDYSFGATNSHRTKVGVRYAMSDLMDTKKFRPYIGLAWEREYKGDTVATVRGFGEAPSPSMKGNSGILEIGCKQEVGKWTLGIGAEVFTGKRKGWNGTLQATYNF